MGQIKATIFIIWQFLGIPIWIGLCWGILERVGLNSVLAVILGILLGIVIQTLTTPLAAKLLPKD